MQVEVWAILVRFRFQTLQLHSHIRKHTAHTHDEQEYNIFYSLDKIATIAAIITIVASSLIEASSPLCGEIQWSYEKPDSRQLVCLEKRNFMTKSSTRTCSVNAIIGRMFKWSSEELFLAVWWVHCIWSNSNNYNRYRQILQDINDSGELSESTLRQLEVELQSTSVEVVESILRYRIFSKFLYVVWPFHHFRFSRSLCSFSVESGRTISLAPLLPSVSRILINCVTTTSSIAPTPLALSCLAAELLANVSNESSECANMLIFNASTPTSPSLFSVILSILSMIRSMEHSHESCWLTVQCLRCISGLFRNVPISQLPNHFLHGMN